MAKRRRPAGKTVSRPGDRSAAPVWSALALVATALFALFATLGATQQLEAVDITLAVVALCGMVGGYIVITSRPVVQPTRLTIAWTGFVAWSFIALVASGRGWTAFVGEATALTGWASFAAVTLIAWAAAIRYAPLKGLLIAVAPWLVAFQCGFAIVQVLLGGSGAGTLPNSTYLGEMVVILLPWVLAPSDERHGRDLWVRVGVVLLAVAALGASGSRVAAVVALVWAVWTFTRLTAAPAVVRRWAGPVAVIAVLAGGLVFARAEVLGSVGVATLGGRPSMWRLAALAVAARPVLGWGPDGFVAGGSAVMTPELAERGLNLVFRFGTTDPHNLLVFIAVSTGVVGLALFVWFAVETVIRWRRLATEGLFNAPAAWGFALCVAILLTAPPSPHILPLLALTAGVSVAPLVRRAREARWQKPMALVAAGALSLCMFALGANALARLPYESAGAEVSPAKAAGSQRTAELFSFDPHLAYLSSLHLGFAAQTDPALASRQPDLVAIERAARLDSRNPFYALEWARTLGFYGAQPSKVESAFQETLRRYPGFPAARAEYAFFLAEQGRDDEARAQLKIARLVDDSDPQVRQAIEATEKALAE